MSGEMNDTFFTQYGKNFNLHQIKKNTLIPFRDHHQLPILVDILARKNTHHALLQINFSDNLQQSFLEALILHLGTEHIPLPLKNNELILLNIENIIIPITRQITIENDFQRMRDSLDHSDKYLLLALPNSHFLANEKPNEDNLLRRQLALLIKHPKCRVIILSKPGDLALKSQYLEQFATLSIDGPTEADMMNVLKQQREDFEDYHHVVIPDELLKSAYELASRYLGARDVLNNTLHLLDSSAARAAATERSELNQFKPVLTQTILTHVLSTWTHIPASCLIVNKFKYGDFIQSMQQRIFGQEVAINLIGHQVQQAQTHLEHASAPFCSFLFAGPLHAGKYAMATALTEQLFKQLNSLYLVQPAMTFVNSFADVKVSRSTDKKTILLKQLIQELPYVIILIENIEQLPAIILDGIHEVLSTGLLHDDSGNQYDFRKAILILSTTLGESKLQLLSKSSQSEENTDADFMQLLMREQKVATADAVEHYTPEELSLEIKHELSTTALNQILNHVAVVPFLPLTRVAIEQIIRVRLKSLGKLLETQHGVELSYAQEVLRYLANQVLVVGESGKSNNIEKPLKDLYFVVEQAILSQADNRNRPTQLFLQLNETGQLLRCDWLTMSRQNAG